MTATKTRAHGAVWPSMGLLGPAKAGAHGLLVGALLSLLAVSGNAQAPVEGPVQPAPARASLLGRVGIERLVRSLESTQPEMRLHAIQRLGRIGNPAALEALVAFARKPESPLGASDRLALVRALAPHVAHVQSRQLLASFLVQPQGDKNQEQSAAFVSLVRDGAALALAEDGGAAGLAVLGQALRTEGPAAAAARRAIEAHPPARLEPLLDAPGAPTPELARLLGRLGDQRAFERLRDFARGESAALRAAAAVALTELGDLETEPLAERWLEQGSVELRPAALEILTLTNHPRAAAALGAELAQGELSQSLRRALLAYPDASFEQAALARVAGGDAKSAPWLWTLLGRIGGERAAEQLARALSTEEGALAAHALAQAAGEEAQRVVLDLLEHKPLSALLVRVASARAYTRGESFAELAGTLGALTAAPDPSLRAAAAWGHSLLDRDAALLALRSGDEARVLAVANNALLFDDELTAESIARLMQAGPGRSKLGFGAALVQPSGRARASSQLLLGLVDAESALRPLALRALAARADPTLQPLIERYLNGPDPLLRAHVARGLGESSSPNVNGQLIQRYEREEDGAVRRALVMALSLRKGTLVTKALELAARLDPELEVRAAARLALNGVRLGDPAPGRELAWVELRSVAGDANGETALLVLAPGLALPVFASPDGLLMAAGLNARPVDLRFP